MVTPTIMISVVFLLVLVHLFLEGPLLLEAQFLNDIFFSPTLETLTFV